MFFRRLIVCAIVLTTSACLIDALIRTLAPGGWTGAKLAMLAGGLGAAPWVGLCAANGLIGFVLRLSRPAVPRGTAADDPPPGPSPGPPPGSPPGPFPRTVIAVAVRNEDMGLVLPSLGRLLDGLDAAGAGEAFACFVLSDTNDPALAAAEERAVSLFRARGFDAERRDSEGTAEERPDRIGYRRRSDNGGFKAGNVMEFLDRHADGFELMLLLDADSEMTPRAVLRLAQAMRDDPRLGIIQHLTVGQPASPAFTRLFQFGMRAGMRTWAAALDWWQGDSCVYWGHNAMIRIAPFRAHARLPRLPGGGHILSHDQVEAAMLRGAGWHIRLLPEEDGSYEANPPALPEFMRRELRWLAGNFEYRHLLAMPGLRPMGRWQLIQAILLFGGSPFYLLFLLAAAWAAASDPLSPFPRGPALATTLIWAGALYAPKLLGYLEVLLSPDKRARHGGAARVLAGVALETVFTLLMDAVNTLAKTIATVRVVLGLRDPWIPQNRGGRGVPWSEATRLLWPQTLLGLAVFACFAWAGRTAVLWAVPFALGLPLAIPFCVVTARPSVGAWLRKRRLAAIPEEFSPPS